MTTIFVVSFGHKQADGIPAYADFVLDLRAYLDPHNVSPEMREMTARDELVVDTVRNTPGIRAAITAAAASVIALAERADAPEALYIGVGCTGGRHRAPVGAWMLTQILNALGYQAEAIHRDIDLPVLAR